MTADIPYTLTQLRYFEAVAHHGGMTRAAHHLHISQSALSGSISSLESALSVKLFTRDPARGLRLTDAGSRFRLGAREVLEGARALAESVREGESRERAILRVGVFAPLNSTRMPGIIDVCARLDPPLHLSVSEYDLAGLLTALDADECDVILGYDLGLPEGASRDIVAESTPYLLLPKGHARATRPIEAVDIASLDTEIMIWLDLPHTDEYYSTVFARANIAPRIGYRVGGVDSVRAFVAAGHGIALLNQRFPATVDAAAGLTTRELSGAQPALRVCILAGPRAAASARLADFAAACRAAFSRDGAIVSGVNPDR